MRGEQAQSTDIQPNNFDLLRLLAACQVVFGHMVDHSFALAHPFWEQVIRQAPGVPIFFFISGFLISASWERHSDLRSYAYNRFLRIYPAYILAAIVSLIAVLFFAPVAHHGAMLASWFGSQFVLVPWTPGFLRGYGAGSINGSLWTIPVEVSFCVATPILHRIAPKGNRKDGWLIAMTALSLGSMFALLFTPRSLAEFVARTPIPWFWMYCCGWLARRHLNLLLPLVQGRVLWLAVLNLALMSACVHWRMEPFLFSGSRFISPVNFVLLALFLLAVAFSARDVANRVLRRNDLSYGIYLFHMPIANLVLVNGLTGIVGAFATAVFTVVVAAFSWFFLEKPLLARRSAPFYRHNG